MGLSDTPLEDYGGGKMIRKKNKKAYKMLERLLQDDYVKIGVLNNPDPGTPPG